MKVLDITEFYSERGGGIRSHLTTRGHFLCQGQHDHVLLAPGPRDEETPVCSNVTQGAKGSSRVVRFAGPTLPYDRTYHLLGRFDKIRERVRRERPDVLEAHSPYLAAAGALACGRAASRLRTFFWHSDHVGTYVEPALEKLLGRRRARTGAAPLWRMTGTLLARFDATFAAGRAQAERLRAAGVRRVVLCPFGVDTRIFRPAMRSEEWRRTWATGAPPGAALLVGVGRFAAEKHWELVLEAFRLVCARRPAVLVLYGDGPERDRLRALAPPDVRFAGFETDRTRLAAALASADLLVHGGPHETFGLGVAEAVASGLPVVVPDAGGAAESVDPRSGEVYRSLDPRACAAAIDRMLSRRPDELRTLAEQAASHVRTLEHHFAGVLDTYDELLEEKRARDWGIRC
ncbi:MAG TPA: glycosyltransferase [Polyangiaceae bacterium]|nr:glycosyltransferase [Polyangiaceae bacterium]